VEIEESLVCSDLRGGGSSPGDRFQLDLAEFIKEADAPTCSGRDASPALTPCGVSSFNYSILLDGDQSRSPEVSLSILMPGSTLVCTTVLMSPYQ
jgi:hypothetical protein